MFLSTTIATTRVVPRSALRHRPIAHTDEPRTVPDMPTPRASRANTSEQSRPTLDLNRSTESSMSATRANEKQQRMPRKTEQLPERERRTVAHSRQWQYSLHWTVLVGAAMLSMLLLMWLWQVVYAWGTNVYDDIHYGRPRTTQVDAFVGHEQGQTPSHFIALNDHGRVEIIEFPGGDATHARIFIGPQFTGTSADLIPVNITFVDTQHNHHPNMIIEAQQSQFTFKNVNGTFVTPTQ